MPVDSSDKPTFEEYTDWYSDWLGEDLQSGGAERWFDEITNDGVRTLERSEFWRMLQQNLEDWNIAFKLDHSEYSLY